MAAPFPTHNATLDVVFTRYAYALVGTAEYKDQKHKIRPLLMLFDEKKLSYDGGAQIVHRVNLGSTSNAKSLSRNQKFSISGALNQTWSRYQPSVLVESCFVSWWDIAETRGSNFRQRAESVLRSSITETDEYLADTVVTQLSQTTAAVSTDINPLLPIVKTTGATGGLNPSTAGVETWAAQNEDTIDWDIEGVGRTRSGVRAVEDRKGKIDVILLPDAYWDQTCEIGDVMTQFTDSNTTRGGTRYANLGTKVPFILDIPVIHDPAWNTAQTATCVGLDLNGIHMVSDSQWDDYFYPFKEMAQHGQLGQASVKVKKCQITCSSRRTQLLLSNLS